MPNPVAAPISIPDPSCMDDFDPSSLLVEQALERIHALATPVSGTERVAVRETLGRVLAEPIHSPIDVPAHDNSAMDGYAVRAADAEGDHRPTALRVLGTAWGRPALPRPGRPRGVRAHHDRGGDALRRRRGGDPGEDRGRTRGYHPLRRAPRHGGQRARGGRGHSPGRGGPRCRTAGRAGGARSARIAGHRRGERPAPGTGRLLLHRRRAPLARGAARRGLHLRQQPLHPPRHAARHRGGSPGPRGGPGRARGGRAGVPGSGRGGRRDHHLGRGFGGGSGLREGNAGADRRGRLLEDRDEAGPPARIRKGGPRPLSSGCPGIRCR